LKLTKLWAIPLSAIPIEIYHIPFYLSDAKMSKGPVKAKLKQQNRHAKIPMQVIFFLFCGIFPIKKELMEKVKISKLIKLTKVIWLEP
jgi:hypothetical protein